MKNIAKCILIFIFIQILRCTGRDIIMEPRVVGGGYANISHYPHVVFLSVHCFNGLGVAACGSSVLNQKIVLTAAHCVEACQFNGENNHTIDLMAGHVHLKKMTINRKAENFVIHKDYDETTVSNDVALIVIKGTFPLGDNLKRIIITRAFPDSHIAAHGYVAGWGAYDELHRTTSKSLKYVYQRLRSVETCALMGDLDLGMFCAGSLEANKSYPCSGDSGSALVIKDGIQQIGLVSFRIPSLFPAMMVYTNISYYYDWILINTQTLYCTSKDKIENNK